MNWTWVQAHHNLYFEWFFSCFAWNLTIKTYDLTWDLLQVTWDLWQMNWDLTWTCAERFKSSSATYRIENNRIDLYCLNWENNTLVCPVLGIRAVVWVFEVTECFDSMWNKAFLRACLLAQGYTVPAGLDLGRIDMIWTTAYCWMIFPFNFNIGWYVLWRTYVGNFFGSNSNMTI